MNMLQQMFNFAQQVLGIKTKTKKGKRPFMSTPGGLPANIHPSGRVERKAAIVQFNAAPHTTREGKPVLAKDKQGKTYQVMTHRAVDRRTLKQAVYQAERAKRGRYVGPFGAPSKEARV